MLGILPETPFNTANSWLTVAADKNTLTRLDASKLLFAATVCPKCCRYSSSAVARFSLCCFSFSVASSAFLQAAVEKVSAATIATAERDNTLLKGVLRSFDFGNNVVRFYHVGKAGVYAPSSRFVLLRWCGLGVPLCAEVGVE